MTTTNLSALKAELTTYIDQRIAEAAPKEKEWPQKGDKYESIDVFSGVTGYIWMDDYVDRGRLVIGNVFRPGDGIKQLEALKVVAELRRCEGCKRFEFGERNHGFSPLKDNLLLDFWSAHDIGWQGIYFSTPEQRDAAMLKVGEQRILAAAEWFRRGLE